MGDLIFSKELENFATASTELMENALKTCERKMMHDIIV